MRKNVLENKEIRLSCCWKKNFIFQYIYNFNNAASSLSLFLRCNISLFMTMTMMMVGRIEDTRRMIEKSLQSMSLFLTKAFLRIGFIHLTERDQKHLTMIQNACLLLYKHDFEKKTVLNCADLSLSIVTRSSSFNPLYDRSG